MPEKKTSQKLYEEKLKRLEIATSVKEPDRVPIAVATIYFPARYAGITYHDFFYDSSKFAEAAVKFGKSFNWDAVSYLRSFESVTLGLALAGVDASLAVSVATASVLGGGFSHDILGDKYVSHPGRELPENVESQFRIKEPLMNADEYDKLLEDPFGFLAGTVAPRAYKSLEKPGSPEAMGALIKLGIELGKFPPVLGEFIGKMKEAACPPWYIALAPNPLDALGAFLRDFDKLMLDLYRMPEKVKKTCETLAPVLAAVGKATGKMSFEFTGSRRVFCPVWYNSFLSPKMYREFHWPYLLSIVDELVKADLTPLICYQGEHEHLLETVLDLPRGKTIVWFDKTDPRKAKKVIGDHSCIAGGIRPSILIGGTPKKVEEEVKRLLEDMMPGGGFIFTLPFNAIGDAKVDNVKAMTEAVMKYGKY